MEYLFYCRDKPGTRALRDELLEAHWSFMDGYAEGMIARGPTFAPDGETVTGSVHIVDLPDAEAARVFAFAEPNHRAGVYEEEVLIRRWHNTLGRKMWDFKGSSEGHPRFLILGHAKAGVAATRDRLRAEQRRWLLHGDYRENLIVCGPLLSEDAAEDWLGTAILAELPDRPAAEDLLAQGPYARAGLYRNIEVHDWCFGGRSED
ncbi:YciI family protein (plasmid) [Embleya sp. NBC_00888]|uniref:YciI family protein n=1 Tax=Embleya sp. NBC_00888 TaxID=2975960 RepID=UPI002F91B87E|nr:YciI family protein [Embleya sp. NBC_00888]